MRHFYLVLFAFFIHGIAQAQLAAGTYTIDNTQATGNYNYQSFTHALNDMTSGVAGHVIFEVSAGQVFDESLLITVSGTASATITFRRAGAGDNPKITRAGTSAAAEYVVKLSGADYITFDGIDLSKPVPLPVTGWNTAFS